MAFALVLTDGPRGGSLARMIRCVLQIHFPLFVAALALSAALPASAMVGGAPAFEDGVGRSVVTIIGSRGTFCTGALTAPDLPLSAPPCLMPPSTSNIA